MNINTTNSQTTLIIKTNLSINSSIIYQNENKNKSQPTDILDNLIIKYSIFFLQIQLYINDIFI